MVRAGCRSGNRSRTEAGFIGEDTAGDAPAHSLESRSNDGTADTTGDGIEGKGHAEHFSDASRHSGPVGDDDDDRCDEIESRHEGDDDTGNTADALDAPQENGQGQDGNDGADEIRRDGIARKEGCRNGIGLGHIADAKGRADGKEGEEPGQGVAADFILDAILHGIHRTAAHFANAVRFAVLDGQDRFTVLRRKAETGTDPHPDQGAWSAQDHGRGDADDVARADSGRQGRHERLERRDVAGMFAVAENHHDGIVQVPPRQEFQTDGQENACPDQKGQHDRPPDEIIDILQNHTDIHTKLPLYKDSAPKCSQKASNHMLYI